MAGNSFSGSILEIPGLTVDRFNNNYGSVFLLTHCHMDHLCGFENQSFSGTVYCSQTTKNLLALSKKYSHNMKYVRALEINQLYHVQVENQHINIRLIKSYHCPGSAMFLIESSQSTILCTGDLRAEKWWVNSLLNENPYLFKFTTGKKIDMIYLDTTFGYRGEPYIKMLSNNEGINIVILLLKSYPLEDPDVNINFVDTILGFEEAWSKIVSSFDESLHLSDELSQRMKVLGGVYNDITLSSSRLSKFHACGDFSKIACPTVHNSDTDSVCIKVRQCVNFNAVDFAGVLCPILIDSLSDKEKSKMSRIGQTNLGTKIFKFRDREWILPAQGKELLATEIKLVFSRHSSYPECCNFIQTFMPVEVYPCVDSEDTWRAGMSMSRVFGKICNNIQPKSPLSYKYDTLKLKQWGLPHKDIRNRQVKVIDRWDIVECQKEMQIAFEFVSSKDKYKFRGQHWTSKFANPGYSEDDRAFDLAKKKDYSLQNIVIARGERTYRKIIQNLQRLYGNYYTDKGKGFNIDSEISEEDLHMKAGGERGVLKLGGLDGYNYDEESSSGEEECSACLIESSDINDDETDIDDEEEDTDISKAKENCKPTLVVEPKVLVTSLKRQHVAVEPDSLSGIPSQAVEVGDFLVFKRLKSSFEGTILDNNHNKSVTPSIKTEQHPSFKMSFQVLFQRSTDIENSLESTHMSNKKENGVCDDMGEVKPKLPNLERNLERNLKRNPERKRIDLLELN